MENITQIYSNEILNFRRNIHSRMKPYESVFEADDRFKNHIIETKIKPFITKFLPKVKKTITELKKSIETSP